MRHRADQVGFLLLLFIAIGAVEPIGRHARATDPPPPKRAQEFAGIGGPWPPASSDKVVKISGVYPHLAVYNSAGECGIGALASWAERLWWITYPPHQPAGSDDQLYSVTPDLKLTAHPESVGGTHANRMVHAESNQLIIGPYFISAAGKVRAADPRVLRARLTATTRHLIDPARTVFFAGMERELYEVDVHTLETRRIHGEMQGPFPGYHGKGAIVAQGRLIVANNGEKGWEVRKDPRFLGPAGCLAESDGSDWSKPFDVVERTNFTEVTGPGGLRGFQDAASADDRVWALGWDRRSVLLKLREAGHWRSYRLPKGSYSHDALHGWFTEWPRIREVTGGQWLMHMHGLFYEFPPTFSAANTGGLRPISTYLKMPVDYCAWQDQLVMACDDASIMQNPLAGQSHSNLRFLQLADLAGYGPAAGWGGPWIEDKVKAATPSDPFLVRGFTAGVLHLQNAGAEALAISMEADADGSGLWKAIARIEVPPHGYTFHILGSAFQNTWLRLSSDRDAARVTAYFHLTNPARAPDPQLFRSLLRAEDAGRLDHSTGVIKPADHDARTLLFCANRPNRPADRVATALYTINGALELQRSDDEARAAVLLAKYGVTNSEPGARYLIDERSVVIKEGGQRYRLPLNPDRSEAFDLANWGPAAPFSRFKREVVTERSLYHAHGTFYELPREASGGFRRVRPVATHHCAITDFASWRGLLVLAGVKGKAETAGDPHIVRSDDGDAALWLGEVDDLWKLGPPRGIGAVWKESAVLAGEPSDPYLMAGYRRKSLQLSHTATEPATFRVQVDFLADGSWHEYAKLTVPAGETLEHNFPDGYSAHWVRLVPDRSGIASALFRYQP